MIFRRKRKTPPPEAMQAKEHARAEAESAAAELERQRAQLPRAMEIKEQLRRLNAANHFDRMIWDQFMKSAR